MQIIRTQKHGDFRANDFEQGLFRGVSAAAALHMASNQTVSEPAVVLSRLMFFLALLGILWVCVRRKCDLFAGTLCTYDCCAIHRTDSNDHTKRLPYKFELREMVPTEITHVAYCCCCWSLKEPWNRFNGVRPTAAMDANVSYVQ